MAGSVSDSGWVLALAMAMFGSACGGSSGPGLGPDGGAEASDAGPDAPDANPVESCTGIELLNSGRLDFDLEVIQVTGRVTLNGELLAGAASETPLVFRRSADGSELAVEVSAQGEYRASLVPGDYQLSYRTSQQRCQRGLPCNDGVLAQAELSTSGALDVDIPSITVQGAITVNGSAATIAGHAIRFKPLADELGEARVLITSADDASSYSATLMPGDYEIWWALDARSRAGCADHETTKLACNDGVLANRELSSSGALDLDIPSVRVKGAVTINGAQANAGSAYIEFRSRDGQRTEIRAPIRGDGEESSYSVSLLPGSYQAWWSPGFDFESACARSQTTSLPCNSGKLREVELATDGALDLDLPSVRLQGDVRLNGEDREFKGQFIGVRGARADREQITVPINVSEAGVSSYSISLVPGDYHLWWQLDPRSQAPCRESLTTTWPCNNGRVASASIDSAGRLDLDLHSARIAGRVVLNGQARDLSRHAISFAGAGDDAAARAEITAPISTSEGSSAYSISLLQGSYEIGWAPQPSTFDGACSAADQEPAPCNSGPLTTQPLMGPGALDLDVPAVRIQGDLTLAGAVLPDAGLSRGRLRFLSTGRAGPLATAELGLSGPAGYELSLLPGSYAIQYDANERACSGGAGAELPCIDALIAGCD